MYSESAVKPAPAPVASVTAGPGAVPVVAGPGAVPVATKPGAASAAGPGAAPVAGPGAAPVNVSLYKSMLYSGTF